MANPHRGAVVLQVGDRAYTLCFSINALCELEDYTGEPVAKLAAGLNDPANIRVSTVRALVWAGLRDHHDEVTLQQAGEIAWEAGIPAVMEAVGAALALAFPDDDGGEEAGARPPKAAPRPPKKP